VKGGGKPRRRGEKMLKKERDDASNPGGTVWLQGKGLFKTKRKYGKKKGGGQAQNQWEPVFL